MTIRRTTMLSLLAVTALSLSLAACDDKKTADQEEAQQTLEDTTLAPVDTPMEGETPADFAATAPAIQAEQATAFATAEGMRTGAVFLKLHNPGAESDRLLSASSDRATLVEIHESYVDEEDGTAQMRRVAGLEIQPNQEVALEPGGYHIMLIDLISPLVEGESFDVTLQFQNAGELVVPITVTAPGALLHETHDHEHQPDPEPNPASPAGDTPAGFDGDATGEEMPAPAPAFPVDETPAAIESDMGEDVPADDTGAQDVPADGADTVQ
ncbi:MAG: copper chaperone PCu(A)C [Micavibrio sp.]